MNKGKVLITGSSGYLGGRISSYLQESGFEVKLGTSVKSNSQGVSIDLKDDNSLNAACKGVSSIIHLAAVNAQYCDDYPEDALLVNSLGTLRLLKAANKNKISKFIYFSTAHIYGLPLFGEINEESLPRPMHSYSISHRTAEDYVIEESSKNQIRAIVLRLTNAVGSPSNPKVNCWMLVANDFCRQTVMEKTIKVNSNKFIERDFVSIKSICSIVGSALNSSVLDDEIFNLSSGISMTLQSLAELIADRSEIILGFRPKISFLNHSEEINIQKLTVSNNKLKKFGLNVNRSLNDDIDELLLNCKLWFA
jgi:UDP-glucose 4-epimerase